MAKMFYTLEEVCRKLGKSEDEVREMVTSGQIQEFRDRDKLMFKVDQIDLLAGGDEESGDVNVELGGSGIGLDSLSGSGSGLGLKDDSSLGLTDSHDAAGLSGASDPNDQDQFNDPMVDTAGETQMTEAVDADLSLEAVGSGSGLLDLTQESDDTTLGAELLEQVYSSDDQIEVPTNASGLFEAAGADSPGDAVGAMPSSVPMVAEAYDGGGSGLGVGLMLGAFASLIVVGIITAVAVQGATSNLAEQIAGSLWIWTGGLAAATLVFGVIGLFIGKASE